MEAFDLFRNELVNSSSSKHKEFSGRINWVNSYNALEYEHQRAQLIELLKGSINWSFKSTKPWLNSLSEGCKICGEGLWSCIFITGKCNAKCFYCPSQQDHDFAPSTQQLSFEHAEDYADYINFFGFKGVGISGGEPLLSFEKTLTFIKAIRKKCSPDVYIWMYTNGILLDRKKARELADAGLNEIRFDIGAVNYKLDKIKKAKGIIKNLTIEIPAVPEEKARLKSMFPEIIDAGVANINLHQLRLTKYNAPKLLEREYTFLHGEQVVVLESELAALEIMQYVAQCDLDIGVNYCCFQFKDRFQKAGFRKSIANKLINANESITEKGYIRELFFNNALLENKTDSESLLVDMDDEDFIQIAYKTLLLENDKEAFKNGYDLQIGNMHYNLSLLKVVNDMVFSKSEFEAYLKMLKEQVARPPEKEYLFKTWKYERIEEGWRTYF